MKNVPSQSRNYGQIKLAEEKYFSSGELFTGVAAGSSVTFYLENTSSNTLYYLDAQNIRSEAKCYVRKWFNPDSISGGSAPSTSILNKYSNSDIGSQANVLVNLTSFTGGSSQFSTKLLGANTAGIRAGGGASAPSNVLQPGDSLLLEISNESANPEDISIDIDWVEEER